MPARHDIVVMGGGPAGCITARGLAALGYDVALVDRPRPFPLLEGVAARAFDGLTAAGCNRALAEIGEQVGRESHWNGVRSRANRERVVDRSRLDAALLDDARCAGVAVTTGRVGRYRRTGGRWRIEVRGRGHDLIESECLVEARGRQAPRHGARRESGPATTALIRGWRLPAGRRERTAVAAFRDGWAWFASSDQGLGVLQLVVSSERGELPGQGGLVAHYDRLLAQLAEARDWLEGASARGAVRARNAAPTLTRPVAGERFVRVGDAALAVDPLSGHGLFEAIGSGLAAVPVVNTVLRRPATANLARQFIEERATQGFWHSARVGRELYAAERRWPQRPFWRRRRAWPDALPTHSPSVRGPASIRLRPVLADGFVVEREVVVTPDHARGVWRVAGVPLAALWRSVEHRAPTVDALAIRFDCPADDIRVALAWLASRGLLPTDGRPDAGPP